MKDVRTATLYVLHGVLGLRFTYSEVKGLEVPALEVSALAQIKKSCLTTINYVLGK